MSFWESLKAICITATLAVAVIVTLIMSYFISVFGGIIITLVSIYFFVALCIVDSKNKKEPSNE